MFVDEGAGGVQQALPIETALIHIRHPIRLNQRGFALEFLGILCGDLVDHIIALRHRFAPDGIIRFLGFSE